jgi:hypothetical protein
MYADVLRRPRGLLAAFMPFIALHMGAMPAQSGDKLEHHDLVFTMARAAGYGVTEARVIASASWAVDTNDDTIAFQQNRDIRGVIAHEFHSLDRFWEDPDKVAKELIWMPGGNFRYAAQGITLHALGSDERVRPAMDKYLRDQIDHEKDPNAKLVLTGMYLHFLVDSRVHPAVDPTVGHVLEGHAPDYVFTNPKGYTQAATDVLQFLVKQKPQAQLLTTLTDAKGVLDSKKAEIFSGRVVQAISAAYHDVGVDTAFLGNYRDLSSKQKELDERSHRNLEQALRPDFKDVPHGFTIVPFTPISYLADGKGKLQIRAEWIPTASKAGWQGAAITDPVNALNTNKELRDQVRPELVRDVRGWVHTHGLLAVGLPLLSPADASKLVSIEKRLGTAGAEITKDAASALQQRAQSAYQNAVTDAVVFQRQAEGKGIEAITRMKDGTYRVMHVVKDGLKIHDRLESGIGRIYTLDLKATKALADRTGGIKFETAVKIHAALGRPAPELSRRVMLRDDGSVLVSNNHGAFEEVQIHWAKHEGPVRHPLNAEQKALAADRNRLLDWKKQLEQRTSDLKARAVRFNMNPVDENELNYLKGTKAALNDEINRYNKAHDEFSARKK